LSWTARLEERGSGIGRHGSFYGSAISVFLQQSQAPEEVIPIPLSLETIVEILKSIARGNTRGKLGSSARIWPFESVKMSKSNVCESFPLHFCSPPPLSRARVGRSSSALRERVDSQIFLVRERSTCRQISRAQYLRNLLMVGWTCIFWCIFSNPPMCSTAKRQKHVKLTAFRIQEAR